MTMPSGNPGRFAGRDSWGPRPGAKASWLRHGVSLSPRSGGLYTLWSWLGQKGISPGILDVVDGFTTSVILSAKESLQATCSKHPGGACCTTLVRRWGSRIANARHARIDGEALSQRSLRQLSMRRRRLESERTVLWNSERACSSDSFSSTWAPGGKLGATGGTTANTPPANQPGDPPATEGQVPFTRPQPYFPANAPGKAVVDAHERHRPQHLHRRWAPQARALPCDPPDSSIV